MLILRENFGKRGNNHLVTLRELLIQEKIDVIFSEFQENIIIEIKKDVKLFPLIEIQELLNNVLRKIANRKK